MSVLLKIHPRPKNSTPAAKYQHFPTDFFSITSRQKSTKVVGSLSRCNRVKSNNTKNIFDFFLFALYQSGQESTIGHCHQMKDNCNLANKIICRSKEL